MHEVAMMNVGQVVTRAACGEQAPPSRGPFVRWVFGAWILLALLAGTAAPASAHVTLLRAAPESGAQLDAAPEEVRLTFSEAVVLAFTRVTLTGPSGGIDLATVAFAPGGRTVVVAPIRAPLEAGTYTVAWQVAGADSHPIRGEFTFLIAEGAAGLEAPVVLPPAPGAAPPPADHHVAKTVSAGSIFSAESPLYIGIRWLSFLGLLGMIGAVAFRLVLVLVRRQEPQLAASLVPPAGARAARLGLWMAVIAGVATLLRLYAQSYALHGAASAFAPNMLGALLTQTLWGWGWWLAAAGAFVAFIGFHLASRTRPPIEVPHSAPRTQARPAPVTAGKGTGERRTNGELMNRTAEASEGPAPTARANVGSRVSGIGWALAGGGVVAAAFSPGMSGHAAAAAKLAPLPIVADGLHVLGAGGWLGSLLVLLLIGIPVALRLSAAERGPAMAALVKAFSPTALLFAGMVVGTGVFAAWLHLGSTPALWESSYGRTLLAKVAVLSIVFATGAYNWLRVKPVLGEEFAAGRLRRSAAIELAAGAVVLAVTAALVATPTPVRSTGVEGTGFEIESAASATSAKSTTGSTDVDGAE